MREGLSIGAACAAVLLAGCGGEPEREKLAAYCARDPGARVCRGSDATAFTANFFKEFEGEWKSNCAAAGPFAPSFIVDTWAFRKNLTIRRTRAFYVDDKCTAPLFTFFHEGSVRADKGTGPYDYLLDFVYDVSNLTPTSDVGATALAQGNACRTVSWEKAKSVDLGQCSFVYKSGDPDEEEFAFTGMETFSGVKRAAGGIVFGDEGKNLFVPRVADRPAALKDAVVYAKKAP